MTLCYGLTKKENLLQRIDHSPPKEFSEKNLTEGFKEIEGFKDLEKRKREHLALALDPSVQTGALSAWEEVELFHDALPEIDFEEVSIACELFGDPISSPIFISSMTGGCQEAFKINERLALACEGRGWFMGVGSQRRQLSASSASSTSSSPSFSSLDSSEAPSVDAFSREWEELRQKAPQALLMGNIGLTQLIEFSVEKVLKVMENFGAKALFVHTNPLQECLQKGGQARFRGGLKALEELVECAFLPIVLKEVGCGFSPLSVEKVRTLQLGALDVSGLGGTHWGRVETLRWKKEDPSHEMGFVFKDWGLSTVQSLFKAKQFPLPYPLWASGGVRSGLDAAKLLAMGADKVGVASPFLQAALKGKDCVVEKMEIFEKTLKVILFCTGSSCLEDLRGRWQWKNQWKNQEKKQ